MIDDARRTPPHGDALLRPIGVELELTVVEVPSIVDLGGRISLAVRHGDLPPIVANRLLELDAREAIAELDRRGIPTLGERLEERRRADLDAFEVQHGPDARASLEQLQDEVNRELTDRILYGVSYRTADGRRIDPDRIARSRPGAPG